MQQGRILVFTSPPFVLTSTASPPPALSSRLILTRPSRVAVCAQVATARHNSLFQRFITALTRGGPGGVPRPIEIHAHDPQRYVNDMLAWVHQVGGWRGAGALLWTNPVIKETVALQGEAAAAHASYCTGAWGAWTCCGRGRG